MFAEFKNGAPSAVTENLAADGMAFSEAEIKERMSSNLCRCGAYVGIVDAIREVFAGEVTP
jgi:xanthine dehydrogenase YagT iron-sulfur-binding subunit